MDCYGRAAVEVQQHTHNGRRADIEGQAISAPTRIARLNADYLLAHDNRGNLPLIFSQNARQLAQHCERCLGLIPFKRQRIADAAEVAALIFQRRRRQRQRDLVDIGVQDNVAVEAHQRGSGVAHQARHFANNIRMGFAATGEPPARRPTPPP